MHKHLPLHLALRLWAGDGRVPRSRVPAPLGKLRTGGVPVTRQTVGDGLASVREGGAWERGRGVVPKRMAQHPEHYNTWSFLLAPRCLGSLAGIVVNFWGFWTLVHLRRQKPLCRKPLKQTVQSSLVVKCLLSEASVNLFWYTFMVGCFSCFCELWRFFCPLFCLAAFFLVTGELSATGLCLLPDRMRALEHGCGLQFIFMRHAHWCVVWASKLHFFECVVVLACCPVERSVSIVVCAGCGSCFDRSWRLFSFRPNGFHAFC